MKTAPSRLVLVTPVLAQCEAFGPVLQAALSGGEVASVLVRLAPADERTLVNRIKLLAPIVQAHETALVVAFDEAGQTGHDIATLAARGGADGVHVEDPGELRLLRERYRDERIVGAGRLRTRHDVMQAGEVGADYVMFGEAGSDGHMPPLHDTLEQARWWAEIFETPCIAVAPRPQDCAALAATGAEFVALAADAWTKAADPAGIVATASGAIARLPGRAA